VKINIIAIGTRMPSWVNDGAKTYLERMPADYQISFTEIPAIKRDKNTDINNLLLKESKLLTSKCRNEQITVALDRLGKEITTKNLASQLQEWHDLSLDLNILIGGPEGIHAEILDTIKYKWSLSKMTLPHPLVRVLIAEQLYRAYSIIVGHPYHR
jgi:23S rRNA (pseudouridine1915-N3)-methyltransferase